jgi:hypothetical protein
MIDLTIYITFLRFATSPLSIAITQRVSISTAPVSGNLGLEPRLPPARDHAAKSTLQGETVSLE